MDGDGFRLGQWLARSRKSCANGKLSEERIEALNALGMVWNKNETYWERMYRSQKSTTKNTATC